MGTRGMGDTSQDGDWMVSRAQLEECRKDNQKAEEAYEVEKGSSITSSEVKDLGGGFTSLKKGTEQFRAKVMKYYKKEGEEKTMKTFNVSKRSIQRWKEHYL